MQQDIQKVTKVRKHPEEQGVSEAEFLTTTGGTGASGATGGKTGATGEKTGATGMGSWRRRQLGHLQLHRLGHLAATTGPSATASTGPAAIAKELAEEEASLADKSFAGLGNCAKDTLAAPTSTGGTGGTGASGASGSAAKAAVDNVATAMLHKKLKAVEGAKEKAVAKKVAREKAMAEKEKILPAKMRRRRRKLNC